MSCELPPITYKPFTRVEERCAVVDCQYITVQVTTTGDAEGNQTVVVRDGATVLPADTELFVCKEPIPTVAVCDTSVETMVLNEGGTTFVRTNIYDAAGNLVSSTDTLLDGTPYTVVSPGDVSTGQRDVERIILYEGSTPFIRTTVYDPAGALVSTTDTNLNGTPYTVVSPSAVSSVPASQFVDVLRGLGVARSIATTTVSARVQLTSTTKAVSIEAVEGPVRFAIGDSTVVANAATSHYLGQGSIKDFAVPAGSWIAAIEATGSSATSLEISELV